MNFDNSQVRRQDRLLDSAEAEALLRSGEYGFMSMVDAGGPAAYGIPVSYAWDGADAIYIHCAPEGRKLACIGRYPNVSFCVVGRTNVISNQFTTEYESVVLDCRARTGLPDDEKMNALRLILEKYSPNDMAVGLKYAEKSFHRTEIIKLEISSMSGKCKRVAAK